MIQNVTSFCLFLWLFRKMLPIKQIKQVEIDWLTVWEIVMFGPGWQKLLCCRVQLVALSLCMHVGPVWPPFKPYWRMLYTLPNHRVHS